MSSEIYSNYKIVHHQDRLIALRAGRQTVPVHVYLYPSDACNLKCDFCMFRGDKLNHELHSFDKANMLPMNKIEEIVYNCHDMGVKAIEVTGGGEPTTHPDIAFILWLVLHEKMELGFVTNGLILKDEVIGELKKSSWVRFSLDAATANTFTKIKGVNAFDRVVRNMSRMVERNKKSVISVSFVITKDNYGEIVQGARLAKGIGLNNIRFGAPSQNRSKEYFDGFYDEARRLIVEAEKLSDNKFKVFNTFKDRLQNLQTGKQDYDFCPMQQIQTHIGADWNVYRCCVMTYSKEGLLGSLKHQTFKQLWESPATIKKIKELKPRRDCQLPCLFEQKNKFINYMLEDNPDHCNFA
jgi:MoaA/NifB/PqqE/SkfB family radical SAM enzyme